MHNERQMSDSFYLALLLTLSGGFLESYTYISRDKVFANAQTGNMIKLAMGITDLNAQEIFRYSLPIIAFVIGIVISCFLRDKYKDNKRVHWRQIVLVIEMLILITVSLIPLGNLNFIANIFVSLICAMQYEAFKKFEGNPFSSLFCTGNLRSFSEQFYQAITRRESVNLKKCSKYLIIICVFMLGVIIGDILTQKLLQYACLLPIILLLSAALLMRKEKI